MFNILYRAVYRSLTIGLATGFMVLNSFAGGPFDGVFDRLDERRNRIIHRVQHSTGVTIGELFIEPDSSHDRAFRITLFDRNHLYRTQVVITEVSDDNLDSKLEDAIQVIIADVTEKREALLVGDSFLADVVNADTWSPAIGTSGGAQIGYPGYVSVWVQLPALMGGEVDVLSVHGTSQWLRTTIDFDGVAKGPDDRSIVVGRASTTIWEVESIEENIREVIRVGTVQGTFRREGGSGEFSSRLDADVFRWSSARAYPVSQELKFFYNTSLRLGLRLIEESEATFRFILGKTLQVGVIIADRFFLSAKLNSEIDYVSNSVLTLGFDAGWRASEFLTVKFGANYRLDNPLDYGVDRMYVLPGGWSFSAGASMRF